MGWEKQTTQKSYQVHKWDGKKGHKKHTYLLAEERDNVLPKLQHRQKDHREAVHVAPFVVPVPTNDLRSDVEKRSHLSPLTFHPRASTTVSALDIVTLRIGSCRSQASTLFRFVFCNLKPFSRCKKHSTLVPSTLSPKTSAGF